MGDLNEIENEEDRRGKFTATKSKIEDKQLKERVKGVFYLRSAACASPHRVNIYT